MVFRGLGCDLSPFWFFLRALSVWFGRMIPGLYEVIQYTLSGRLMARLGERRVMNNLM